MSIPKIMKAAVVEKFREPLSIREVSVPAPLPGEVLVEIVASGVCHTDLHAADGDFLSFAGCVARICTRWANECDSKRI
jgi:D-arabinose 1-dehydrogenase-like Zn-dependent alcohol dehydrogenase